MGIISKQSPAQIKKTIFEVSVSRESRSYFLYHTLNLKHWLSPVFWNCFIFSFYCGFSYTIFKVFITLCLPIFFPMNIGQRIFFLGWASFRTLFWGYLYENSTNCSFNFLNLVVDFFQHFWRSQAIDKSEIW